MLKLTPLALAGALLALPSLAAPALAGNSVTIVQFGDVNTVRGEQNGHRNDARVVQQGRDNWFAARQNGAVNHAEIGQDGRQNHADLNQRRWSSRYWRY